MVDPSCSADRFLWPSASLLSAPVTPERQILLTVLAEFVTEARERAPELAGLADREAAEAMVSRAWAPLLLLNLWHDSRVTAVAEYLVERNRRVERVYSAIPSTYLGPEGDYDAAPGSGNTKLTRAHDRLRRSAVRFLETGDDVGFDGDVNFSENRPGVVLNYVSALENLLSSANEDTIDLRRRAAQRAAILIGRNDVQRKMIHDQVYSAPTVACPSRCTVVTPAATPAG